MTVPAEFNRKRAFLWVVDWTNTTGPNTSATVTADLFFSSRTKFRELLGPSADQEQLVEVYVPASFEVWDFIPENY